MISKPTSVARMRPVSRPRWYELGNSGPRISRKEFVWTSCSIQSRTCHADGKTRTPTSPTNLRQDGDAAHRDIDIQIPNLLLFKRCRIVDLDFKTSAVDIELFTVGRNSHGESCPARNFALVGELVACKVKGPEFTTFRSVNAGRNDRVSLLFVGRDFQARHAGGRRTDWPEVDLSGAEIEPGQAEHFVVNDGV